MAHVLCCGVAQRSNREARLLLHDHYPPLRAKLGVEEAYRIDERANDRYQGPQPHVQPKLSRVTSYPHARFLTAFDYCPSTAVA